MDLQRIVMLEKSRGTISVRWGIKASVTLLKYPTEKLDQIVM